ncbi:type II/IV secretion system protein [Patescibacteria group bacterium]|nr:type II/IV secretion system protein [Patescibacteria group bacterium]
MQSIEDLIKASKNSAVPISIHDESTQAQLARKQQHIKVETMERQAEVFAAQQGLPYINLFGFPISTEAISMIDRDRSRQNSLICFYYDGKRMRLATTNPSNPEIKEIQLQLQEEYFCEVRLYYISQNSFDYAIRLYDKLPKIRKFVQGVEILPEDLERFQKEIKDYKTLNSIINKVTMSEVVTLIIATAMKTGSSDIHIEAEEDSTAVRLRIDGVLQEAARIDKDKWPRIISRMKLLAKVKLNISDKPQDGRFTIFLPNDKLAIRASFLPTSYGESVVMRLLKSSSVGLSFEDLGLSVRGFEILGREIEKPNGLILTTGPTGSGKTTTLYAILNKLNKPSTKIITLEDPIEYQLSGINQSQVDTKKDYTFAKGLRSILRQDPDIVMVGEIRDLETAEIAIQASLTGHLVLSTLHTNDSAGVIPRMVDMGVKPFFLTPSINAIIGQRLVRKLCKECKIEHELKKEEVDKIMKILAVISPKANVSVPAKLPTLYKANEKGCAMCAGVGYKGRVGIYELLEMTKAIKELTSDGQPAFKILEQAIEDGMVTMLQDGIIKVLNSLTSLDEVYRVIGKMDYIDALYDVALSKSMGKGIQITEEDIQKVVDIVVDLTKAREIIAQIPPGGVASVVMALAVKIDAGDIHIEPTEKGVKIRFRIDGILHDIAELTKEYYLPMLSQIKILAGFATNVKKATWDGRFGIHIEERNIDCRVSIISGGYGETVVIRILSSSAASLTMEQLGIQYNTNAIIANSTTKTKGIIITTGPTGSGKTTTLYALLNKLNSPDVKIITIEDPIEYHLDGVMQTQVEGDYTFAAAMRSLLRQNPNIIMVGEIRDQETAKIAVEAAMTGHLVLSTIHANSAAGAVSRFAGLGVEQQMLASALTTSIGQRLIRKICVDCKEETTITPEIKTQVEAILTSIDPSTGVEIPKELKLYKGKGCPTCSNLGYKGRVGLYEAIDVNPNMQKIIQQPDVIEQTIELAAMKNGTITMMQDGVLKALAGETTLEEVFRVAN